MNEQQNVERVQKAYAAFGNGDIQGVLADMSPDIEWIVYARDPGAGRRSGTAEVTEFFGILNETLEITGFEPREFFAQSDKVVVLGWFEGTVKSTGRSYSTEWVHIFTMRDGKTIRFQEYYDADAAAAAFGM